jgi:hypothetical protein
MPFNKIKINSLENSSITTAKIQNDAVTTGKVGPSAATAIKLNTDVITGLTELNETAANTDFVLIYDTSTSSLKKLLKSNLDNTSPTISSITPTNIFSNDSSLTTFTITGTGFTAGSNARLIGNDGTVLSFDTAVRNSTTQITATFNNSSLVLNESGDPYSVQVINGTGQATILSDQVYVDQSPIFVTASGSLGTQRAGTFTASVEATDPDSTGAVTYDIISGSLPTGITLNTSTGVISGSITPESSDTTYNFTIRANDSTSNTSNRAFSITLQGPQITSFTTSGTFSVPAGITTVDVLIVAGGGGGSSHHGGGGGAGGLIFRPAFTVTPGGTVSVTVGDGGAGGFRPSPLLQGNRGQDSVFGTLTAKGGGGGTTDNYLQTSPGNPTELQSGGSGGGTGYQNQSQGGPATQPTQPGDSGTYGFGNAGGYGSGYNGASASGGGGGGAGTVGQNAGLPSTSGVGGNGKSYTIADGTTPVFYAGGGGGGTGGVSPANGGPGGQGGGGAGGASGTNNGQPGQTNKGGGGGGGTTSACTGTSGGTGGKGIVIVKY